MVGMMLHLDASTHAWIAGLPMQDLVVMMDDANSEILFARFFEQEGTLSTLHALHHVLKEHGRFCELYTDKGSHFCLVRPGRAPDDPYSGQVPRALKALGIRQILANSPQARGRSERAFGTIQGRLPQELRTAGIQTYDAANLFLEKVFIPDFNKRFTVKPAQTERAFVSVPTVDLDMLLSAQHERVVLNDGTVVYDGMILQLPPGKDRIHYTRCPVLVHRFIDATWGVSYQGRLLARYGKDGQLLVERRAA
jgi:hypothetical protein